MPICINNNETEVDHQFCRLGAEYVIWWCVASTYELIRKYMQSEGLL